MSLLKHFGAAGLAMTALFLVHPQAAAEESYTVSGNTYTLSISADKDLTDELNAALRDIQTTKSNPGTIVIPAGDYTTGIIRLSKSYVTISAEGAVIRYAGETDFGPYLIKASETALSGVTIRGGVWDGRGLADFVFHFGILSGRHTDLAFIDCAVKNGGRQSIRVSQTKNLTMSGVTVTGSDYGMYLSGCENIVMKDCSASKNGVGFAFRASVGTSNSLTNCTAENNTLDGLQIKDTGTTLTISGGSFSKNGKNGISMTTGAAVTMKNAHADNNTSNGISPVGSKTTITTLKAYSSTFTGNGRHGMAGDSYATIYMKACTANNNARNGIMLNHSCKSAGLIDCTARGNSECGILVQCGSSCAKISGCDCSANKKLGISVSDVTVTIDSCKADSNTKHGIFINHTAGYQADKTVTVTSTQANKNGLNGLFAGGIKAVTITGGTFNKNGQCGIESHDIAMKLSGTKNQIIGNKKNGVAALSGHLYLNGATISGNTNCGVFFDGTSTGGYCINAVISGNRVGVLVNNGALVTKISSNRITGNLELGIQCIPAKSGRKTTLKACSDNRLSNPKAAWELLFSAGVSKPASLTNIRPVRIAGTVRAEATKVSGTASNGLTVVVSVGGKQVGKKTVSAGIFSISTAKLAAKSRVTVSCTTGGKNLIYSAKTL
ncbi:MAG: right-handed parallel beta-helix repeat-containing protein [Oscillospiraceae bacterium]